MFLLLVLVRNPVVFLRALRCGLSPRGIRGRYPPDVLIESARMGLSQQVGNLEGERWSYELKKRYADIHNVARIELHRASSGVAINGSRGVNAWRKVFGPVTPPGQPTNPRRAWFAEGAEIHKEGVLADLADVVMKMTGAIMYAGLTSPAQEALERRLVIPRYIRCLVGILADAIQGRIRGNESRRLLFHCALVAIVVYLFLI